MLASAALIGGVFFAFGPAAKNSLIAKPICRSPSGILELNPLASLLSRCESIASDNEMRSTLTQRNWPGILLKNQVRGPAAADEENTNAPDAPTIPLKLGGVHYSSPGSANARSHEPWLKHSSSFSTPRQDSRRTHDSQRQ